MASSQRSPSSPSREPVEQKEERKENVGVMTPSFWQQQLELQEKRLEIIRKLRQARSPETIKPPDDFEYAPDDDQPPPLKRN